MGKGLLFVLSAPSGAGKSTLIDRIRPLFPAILYSISCTTRPPRRGECDGVHYYFLDEAQFRKMIREGKFLEWKEVHGRLYGTPAEPVAEALGSGQHMILDIDVQGAKEVFRKIPDAIGIFISTPDTETLEERLRSRGTDAEESIRTRMTNALKEMEAAPQFRHRIINDDLETAVRELASIIQRETAKVR